MKITGTKKLLIIFFALVCALATGLGFMISRSGAPSHASAFTYAAGEPLIADDTSDNASDADADTAAEDNTGAVADTADAVIDAGAKEKEIVESSFNELYDEAAVRRVAELFDVEYDLVNLYCRYYNLDARDILDLLLEGQEIAAQEEADYNAYMEKVKNGTVTEEDEVPPMPNTELIGSDIYEDVVNFGLAYVDGEIELEEGAEKEDWFVSPDEVSSYITVYNTWYLSGYLNTNNMGTIAFYTENMNPATASSSAWTNVTSSVVNANNFHVPTTGNYQVPVEGSGATSQYGRYQSSYNTSTRAWTDSDTYRGQTMTSGAWNFYCNSLYQVGFHAKITLEPGQRMILRYNMKTGDGSSSNGTSSRNVVQYSSWGTTNNGNSAVASSSHYVAPVKWYAGSVLMAGTNSDMYIDGDAPTGSMFFITVGYRTTSTATSATQYQKRRVTWNIATSVYCNSSPAAAYLNKSTQYFTYWVEVIRKDPPKPSLIDDTTHPQDSVSGNTKTATFRGDPVTLSVYPDYGATLLKWTAASNSSFTQADASVSMKSRSQHGLEPVVGNGFKAANLVLQTSAKGTHYIKLESPTGRWADGTSGAVTFTLIVQEQFVDRPDMLYETGVSSNKKEKIVNYNEDYQTITFDHVNKELLSYNAPGLEEVSWENDRLILQQKIRGKYTITIFITNSAACSWSDTHTTEPMSYTFWIQEMLIDQPTVVETSSGCTQQGNKFEFDYNGETKQVIVSPAVQERLIIIAAGLQYSFEYVDVNGVTNGPGAVDHYTGRCIFQMTDSGSQTVTIMPDEGYVWRDKTSTPISFSIKINAIPITFPILSSDLQEGQTKNGNVISVMFDPTPGWTTSIVITNIPMDAVSINTAMTTVSWLPVGKNPGDDLTGVIDHDRTVLTLSASNANTYLVTFAIANNNYSWADTGSSVPVFSLIINRRPLDLPKINEDVNSPPQGTSFEGATKTIYWNSNENSGDLWTPEANRFFKMFVGGFTDGKAGLAGDAGQITIRIVKEGETNNEGLRLDWTDIVNNNWNDSTANLTFWAEAAGNYLIYITPTANYCWNDAKNSNDMQEYKFVVSSVLRDTLTMYVKQESNMSWSPSDQSASVNYDGTQKEIRIGSVNNSKEYYINGEMKWALVKNDDHSVVIDTTDSDYPTGFELNIISSGYDSVAQMNITVLEGYATNAGTYTIRLELSDKNYTWRKGGQGVYVYYTFTVVAMSIGTPVLLEDECDGGEGLRVYGAPDNYLYAGYNGNDVQMVIYVKQSQNAKNEDIIELDFNPDNNDEGGIWQETWGSAGYEDGLDRLIIKAVNVGNHKVRLKIKDTNYRWDNDSDFYEFRILIDYALVDDVVFNYGEGSDMQAIGGNGYSYTATYDTDTTHHIVVTRSTDAFSDTKFETQFYYSISYIKPDYPLKAEKYNFDNLVLDFHDANEYEISIYLTDNYRWRSMNGQIGVPLVFTFTVIPKQVNVPVIYDEDERDSAGNLLATINQPAREKTITYDSNTTQSLMLDLGADYMAFVVDEEQTTSFFNRDASVTTSSQKIRYTGKSAGTYELAITLINTNNYYWAGNIITLKFTLIIATREIEIPDAYFILQKDINDEYADYADIQSGAKGTLITPDGDGNYKAGDVYNGKLQYIYLFGYAIENSEVTITITAADETNAAGVGNKNISVGGIVRGHHAYAINVNVYTIKVEFKLSDEFGAPNCHWLGVPFAENSDPRIFTLEITKLGVLLPEIQEDTSLTFNGDRLDYHMDYSGVAGQHFVTINNCLSTSPIDFMTYSYERSRTKAVLDDSTHIIVFTITGIASVGTEYRLIIMLDTQNEYWINPNDSTDISDINDKSIYIVIDKLAVQAPNILFEYDDATYGGEATYDGTVKMYTYNGSAWTNAMRIENILFDRLNYALNDSSMTAVLESGTILAISTSNPNSGNYSVIFNLKDKNNLKWDTTGSSEDFVLTLKIDVIRIDKPFLDDTTSYYNGYFVNGVDHSAYNAAYSPSFDANTNTLTVQYLKDANYVGVEQYIIIENYIKDDTKMTYQVVSASKFKEYGLSGTALKFGATVIGTYEVKIFPSQNVGWIGGGEDPVLITFVIEKQIYQTPEISDPGASLPEPEPTVSGQTRIVTYILNTKQYIEIQNVDTNILRLELTTSNVPDNISDRMLTLVSQTGATNSTTFIFSATNVGIYTIPFSIINYPNIGLSHNNNAPQVIYTFIIQKLDLEVPVFDADTTLLLNDESVTDNDLTFTAIYDNARHGMIVLNVLDTAYITYRPVNDDYLATGQKKDDFFYSAASLSTAAGATIGDVFNSSTYTTKFDGLFADGVTDTSVGIERENYILLHAAKPGTYEVVFTLTDSYNMQWRSGDTDNKFVKIVINKKQILAPEYFSTTEITKPFTGKPVEFHLKNVFGVVDSVKANNIKWVDNSGAPVTTGYTYEICSISAEKLGTQMTAVELNVDTHVLTLKATEIGTYSVTISILEKDYTKWTDSEAVSKTFTFKIGRGAIVPEVTFIDANFSDGSGRDTTTFNDLQNDVFVWPKSTTVTAKVIFSNLAVDTSGVIKMDSDISFNIYYVDNLTSQAYYMSSLGDGYISPMDTASDLFDGTTRLGPSTKDSRWAIEVDAVTGEIYLTLTFAIKPNIQAHGEFIPKGEYSLIVEQGSASNMYTVAYAGAGFEVTADRAPFITDEIYKNIVWEMYYDDKPDIVAHTYDLSNVTFSSIAGATPLWSDMTIDDAVPLAFIEDDNRSYGFRFSLDGPTMGSETDVRTVLQNYKVDWDGTYIGKATAKYFGTYSVSVKIVPLNRDEYSVSPDPLVYTFYYKITQAVYDLGGLEWDYTATTHASNPFVYDKDTTHYVKLKGTLPTGLAIASYDVDGYDSNAQISAKYDSNYANTTDNYYTSVKFLSSNPNYVTPDPNDASTYKNTTGKFSWTVVWGIKKQTISAQWVTSVTADGTATMSIPYLDNHSEKVDYVYRKDDGIAGSLPENWPEVTTFSNEVATWYLADARLKSDPANPELDYANNYELVVTNADYLTKYPAGTAPDFKNAYLHKMDKGDYILVSVYVDGVRQKAPTEYTGDLPDSNIHVYDGVKVFEATVNVTGAPLLSDANFIITYYSTTNTLKPIDAPSAPGHYLVKLRLVPSPGDTNEYYLPNTEYYFDIVKGDFDGNDIYWQYTHKYTDGTTVTAVYDYQWKYWQIVSSVDINGNYDPNHPLNSLILDADIVYDGNSHNVELISKNTALVISTKNKSQIDAGVFTDADKTSAQALISYNGKLWNSPTETPADGSDPAIPMVTFEWEVHKAVIDLSELEWDYTDDYVYTVSGGVEKKFTVRMKDGTVPELLDTFIRYSTYNRSDFDDDCFEADGTPKEADLDEAAGSVSALSSNVLTKAGVYLTKFDYSDFFENEALKKNYEPSDWPSGVPQWLVWEIAVREISVPNSSSWEQYDGTAYDLTEVINLIEDWFEYITISVEYAKLGAATFGAYDGTDEFGNEMYASHAGKYRYTFTIVEGLNTQGDASKGIKESINVVFTDVVTVDAKNNPTATFEVAKAVLSVDGWSGNGELSKAILSGTFTPTDPDEIYEYIDYKFTDLGGTVVSIDKVASSSGESFDMEVYIRAEYADDIDIDNDSDYKTRITTLTVSNVASEQLVVGRVPFIIGYSYPDEGFEHEFEYSEWQQMMVDDPDFFKNLGIDVNTIDEDFDWTEYLGPEEGLDPTDENYDADFVRIAEYKSKVRASVTYDGKPVTFMIYNWSEYSEVLEIWQGKLEHSSAGDYSVTLLFKKDNGISYCWSYKDDNDDDIVEEVDRSAVTLKFRIAFHLLPVPIIQDPTYTGSEIDVLKYSLGDDVLEELLNIYGNYVEIIGYTGTTAGGYTLQLKIKDLYRDTIHWDNGTALGQPGTFTIKWKILPIYVPLPILNGASKIIYDGSSHSIFELFEGYNNGNLSKDLQSLMQLAVISGDTGINAGSYEARFVLPDENYAWLTTTGAVIESSLQSFIWTIQKKPLDMSGIHWNYKEDDPFQYTIEYGEIQPHTLKLEGIPEELEEFITYITDDEIGNVRSNMGTYTTVVYFFQNDIAYDNYSLEGAPSEFLSKYSSSTGYIEITWNIVERRFAVPEDTEFLFDGTVHELLELFGYGEGWENYLDVQVEYKAPGADAYVDYSTIAEYDPILGYSRFNAFYLGDYRVKFSIKSGLNNVTNCVVWLDGVYKVTNDQSAVVTISPLEITIEGWQEDEDGNWTIVSDAYEELLERSPDSEAVFEYIIRDAATGEVLSSMDEVRRRGAGIVYTIEFVIKDGNDYAKSHGIILGCADGVDNPHEFCYDKFPGDQDEVQLWLPLPELVALSDSNVYDGNDKLYQISNWEDYIIDEEFKDLLTEFGLNSEDYVSFLEPIGKYASWVDVTTGIIKVKGAGDFDILVRFIPNVNLSWYNQKDYTYDKDTDTLYVYGTSTVVTNRDSLIDRHAKTLSVSIEKASVPQITAKELENLQLMIPVFEYTGEEYNLKNEVPELFEFLEKYGALIKVTGYTGINAGDYTLKIELTDPNSSYWNLHESETLNVNDKSFAEYDPDYTVMWVEVDGNWVAKYVKPDGKGGYIDYNKGDYILELAYKKYKVVSYISLEGLLDSDGKPETESGNIYVVDDDGKAIRYSLIDGEYVEDPNGTFIAKYSLRVDGTIIEQYEKVDGRNVIDSENCVVNVTRTKTSTDPYEITWSISSSTIGAPTVNPDVQIVYNGSEQFAEKVLLGFKSSYMEIVEGGSGINAGEYTAKIKLKGNNYVWREGVATLEDDGIEYVYVTWKIEKAKVDLSDARWKFTDGTTNYENGAGMVYTRKNGKAVVYWVELDNLPQAVKGSIRYTTNGSIGAYAGTDAGVYHTSFEVLDPYGNFESINIPETFATTITWRIQRRALEVPTINGTQFIFDDEPHDLLSMINLREDWEEYFTISIQYAKNLVVFGAYPGHNGNPFEAYGAGAYKFIFTIRPEINVNPKNPSVVWLIGGTAADDKEEELPELQSDEPEVEEIALSQELFEEPVLSLNATTVDRQNVEVEEEVVKHQSASVATNKADITVSVAQQICDRVKELTYGAQIQLSSYRKYLR